MSDYAMYRGPNQLTLDGKGRIAIPTRFRELLHKQCKGRVVVAADSNRALLIYPLPAYEKAAAKLDGMNYDDPRDRRIIEMRSGMIDERQVDNQGRLLITPLLREHAELEREAVLMGVADKLQLLSKQEFDRRRREDWVDLSPGAA